MKCGVICLCLGLWALALHRAVSEEVQPRTKLGEFARDHLTSEEKKWLIENPVIRYSADPDWPPFSFGDIEGRLWGIEADLLAAISEQTGLRFEYVPHESWTSIYRSLKAGGIHFVPGVARTPAREEEIIFSDRYWNFPVVIITRKDEPFHKSVESLASMRVVMPKDHVSTDYIRRNYPSVTFTELDTTAESIEAVARHRADATVENLAAASYIIRNMRHNNLKVSGLMAYDFAGHFALRKDEPMLRSILQKALNKLDPKEKERIFNKWTTGDVEGAHLWHSSLRRAQGWGYFLGAILLVSIFWIVLLLYQIRERKKAQHLLVSANARLVESNEQKNRNIGIIVHDLRSPLTHLSLSLELLKSQVSGLPGSMGHSINEMLSSVNYMESSVNNLLDIHKIEQGSIALKSQPVEMFSTIQECVSRLESSAQAKSISICLDPPADAADKIFVSADPHALSHVVDNLLSNAIKYSPVQSEVRIHVFCQKEVGAFSVIDQGPGISAEEEPGLFQAFSRLSAKPTGGESSTGLGLSIVKYFVEKMRGTVTLQKSAEAKGACFTVSLPLIRDDGLLKK
ncbi:transporter substrate-binding domain-containing protein [Kamptonema cortianum]|nr:transporter substrate-binding domain-containing protein [Oscillatoria laete-virens]MDK3159584.1 transporter substrate-binding domain-containing protein [Kamptonema cortianum]MDL5053278.1 transporter substrate-binding domain-containing protein [Oscillatoria laete-virens NRMC-F 0139]